MPSSVVHRPTDLQGNGKQVRQAFLCISSQIQKGAWQTHLHLLMMTQQAKSMCAEGRGDLLRGFSFHACLLSHIYHSGT